MFGTYSFFPDARNRKVTFNAIGFGRRKGKRYCNERCFFPGAIRFGKGVRATRTVLNDIESAARAKAGSSRERQDKR